VELTALPTAAQLVPREVLELSVQQPPAAEQSAQAAWEQLEPQVPQLRAEPARVAQAPCTPVPVAVAEEQ
jgi:hypothetical protein